MAMLKNKDIQNLGFQSIGKNVKISDKATFYNCSKISIADNSRIDDFCVLAAGEGGIEIGSHVHIAVGSTIIGTGKITLSDFSGISSRVAIYSSSDDYSGRTMTNPTVPSEFTSVTHADVFLGKHVIVGSGSVILPGVTIEEGVAIGALSLVTKDCRSFGIYAGNPAKRIRDRKKNLLDLERLLREKNLNN
jgi:acetyltransferase-like isoleucine patch superfamily enzyme